MEDPKAIVEYAYDNVWEWYLNWAVEQKSPRERYTEKVLVGAPASPNILELGCGAGVPIVRNLLDRGAKVVGNDISRKQIELAKARCPEATLIAGDMATLEFPDEHFEGAVAFYSLFHLPREEYKLFLKKVFNWLKPGSKFAFNLATVDEDEIYGELMGYGMFWSSYGQSDNLKILEEAGFAILEANLLESGEGQLEEDDPDYGVEFLWVVVQKAASSA